MVIVVRPGGFQVRIKKGEFYFRPETESIEFSNQAGAIAWMSSAAGRVYCAGVRCRCSASSIQQGQYEL